MSILVGVLAAVIFILNVVVKALLRRERVGFIDWTLAILTTALVVAAVTIEQLRVDSDPAWLQIALLTGVSVAAVGLVVIILDVVRKQRILASRGLLALGVGALLALSSVSVPYTSTALAFPTPTPIQVAQLSAAATRQPTVTRAQPTVAPPSPTPLAATPSLTATPLPPTATLWTYATRTPLPTATPVTPCLATTDFNLRLRAAPSREAETLSVIPFGTVIMLTGRSEGSAWWYAELDGQTGWLDGEFLTLSAACERLPLRSE